MARRLALGFLGFGLALALIAALAVRYVESPRIAALVVLAAGLLGALVVHRVVVSPVARALRALGDAVGALEDGELGLRLAIRRDDELGELAGVVNQLADVLQRERHDVRQKQLLLETALESTPSALVLADESGRVVFSNRAARIMLRRGRRLEGHRCAELLESAPSSLREAFLDGRDALVEIEAEGARESLQMAHRRFVLDQRPHVLTVVHRLTQDLRRQEVAIWKRVLRTISHELRNSLAPLRSLAHSARRARESPEHADRLDEILEAMSERARHLGEFVDGYAEFARLPAPQPRQVTWGEILRNVRGAVTFAGKDLPLAASAHCDPGQMEQVLINLLRNAHESGSPNDEVSLEIRPGYEGGTLVLVQDRGHGMTDEAFARALLPFYSTKPDGAGVGLPLCREILEAHGGRLRLQRREGGGMTVACWLPARVRRA